MTPEITQSFKDQIHLRAMERRIEETHDNLLRIGTHYGDFNQLVERYHEKNWNPSLVHKYEVLSKCLHSE